MLEKKPDSLYPSQSSLESEELFVFPVIWLVHFGLIDIFYTLAREVTTQANCLSATFVFSFSAFLILHVDTKADCSADCSFFSAFLC